MASVACVSLVDVNSLSTELHIDNVTGALVMPIGQDVIIPSLFILFCFLSSKTNVDPLQCRHYQIETLLNSIKLHLQILQIASIIFFDFLSYSISSCSILKIIDYPVLPPRMFASGKEPIGERVNSYHKIKQTESILDALDFQETKFLRKSIFRKIIALEKNTLFFGAFGQFIIVLMLKVNKKNTRYGLCLPVVLYDSL